MCFFQSETLIYIRQEIQNKRVHVACECVRLRVRDGEKGELHHMHKHECVHAHKR